MVFWVASSLVKYVNVLPKRGITQASAALTRHSRVLYNSLSLNLHHATNSFWISPKRIEQEGRILLAIEARKNGGKCSLRQLARDFDISDRTLRRRLVGIKCREETRANSYKLTISEEDTLYN
jgi:hypothetical protein